MIWCTYTFRCVMFFLSVTYQYLFCTDMTISAFWYPNFLQWTFSNSNIWLIKETLIFIGQNRNFCNKELGPLSDLLLNHALPDPVILSLLCVLALKFVSPCIIVQFKYITNQMQQFFTLLSWRLFTAQHVSGVLPPIIRSSTAVAASGFTFVSWW
jgi:hypothetical protein